ncbi:MAG: energy transducer TonB [Sphingobacteriales bacterium]|nr:MAG: energy transducer TonB [Sphingobacteriales bacterium]TAF78626.1 MAG: energy transducer TonB [Sphingobacteriales bacterium]
MPTLNQPDNNYPKAIAYAVSIVVGLLVLSLFYVIKQSQTPPEEVGIGGITVNYGTTDEGMGTDFMSIKEPSIAPSANQKNPDKVTPEQITPTQNPTSQATDENILTQDIEDALALNTKANASNNPPAPKTNAKEAKPIINQNALYKGKKNNGTGEGDGNGKVAGNQGKPEGDPLSNNYNGTGSGNGGVALTLEGRRFVTSPIIKDDGQKTGKIAVNITVDKNGTVISAEAPGRGSTLTDPQLCDKCEKAVLGAKFNTLETAPNEQRGVVVFNFKLN